MCGAPKSEDARPTAAKAPASKPNTNKPAIKKRSPTVSARNLDGVIKRARNDLAEKLGIEPASIGRTDVQRMTWPDQSLGCEDQPKPKAPAPTVGFIFTMVAQGRIFTYHTDRDRVFPCPAIEME